ncbi:MAG: hypothetical protein FWB75_07935 [Oscillospiraceae bacterium]|nr:hypothetical protein [Oscillospiraceae bacterium]
MRTFNAIIDWGLYLIFLVITLGFTLFVYELIPTQLLLAYLSVCALIGIASLLQVTRGPIGGMASFVVGIAAILNLVAMCIFLTINYSWLHIFGLIAAYFLTRRMTVTPILGKYKQIDIEHMRDEAVAEAVSLEHKKYEMSIEQLREAHQVELHDFFAAANLKNPYTGNAIGCMYDFWEWKRENKKRHREPLVYKTNNKVLEQQEAKDSVVAVPTGAGSKI